MVRFARESAHQDQKPQIRGLLNSEPYVYTEAVVLSSLSQDPCMQVPKLVRIPAGQPPAWTRSEQVSVFLPLAKTDHALLTLQRYLA